MENKSILHDANEAFRSGRLDEALRLYQAAIEDAPLLAPIITPNVELTRRRLSRAESANIERGGARAAPSGRQKTAKGAPEDIERHRGAALPAAKTSPQDPPAAKIAVVLHAYHQDVVEEVLDHIGRIPAAFDLLVTTPLPDDAPAIKRIIERHPRAVIRFSRNRGRDVLPFLQILPDVLKYDLCLKVHTKRGLTNYGDIWREVSLKALLGSARKAAQIIQLFDRDPDLMLAGPKPFYASGRRMMFGNKAAVAAVCDHLGLEYRDDAEWGFFAGTMFWFRPSLFAPHCRKLAAVQFEKETGRQDGGIEHALERIFGLIPSILQAKALLIGEGDREDSIETITLPGKPGATEPTKALEDIAAGKRSKLKISGDVNKQASADLSLMKVKGWLARLTDGSPRSYVLRIGEQEFFGKADVYRADLEDAGINAGCHAFEVIVPLKYADGLEHAVSLFDVDSGLPVASSKYRWPAVKRDYRDFESYLAWSYGGQYVSVPFVEEDKRAFAFMEQLAGKLVAQCAGREGECKFSIIMPAYNRAGIIASAIASVIAQTYQNWELIIVDDGSTDGTGDVVRGFPDPRIIYIENKVNAGVSAARNTALRSATGDYVAYLDTDNDWDRRYLAAMAGAILGSVRSARALYCGQFVFSGKERSLAGVRFGLFNKSLLLNNNFIDLNCFVHARGLGGEQGSFDEQLPRFVDWDFIVRLTRHSPIASVPVILSNYYLNATANSLTADATLYDRIEVVRKKIDDFRMEARRSHFATGRDAAVPGVSFVIPSYKALGDLAKCLESVAPYLADARNELIVVDNHSGDDVLEAIDLFCRNHARNARVIALPQNFGFTYAANRGLEAARADNDVLLLNNDAILCAGSVEELQSVVHSSAGYGLAVPAQVLPGGTETLCTHVPYALPEFEVDVNVSAHHRNLHRPPLFYEGEPLEVEFAPFFCVLIKNSTRRKVPLLDEVNGRHYRSDRTYCSYVRSAFGLAVIYCPDSRVLHGLQKSTRELKSLKKGSAEFSRIFLENTWSGAEASELRFELPTWNRVF